MDLDGLFVIISVLLVLFLIVFSYIIGRWMDPVWRCRFLRKISRKDYIVLNMKSSDGKTIETRVVNAEGDTVRVNEAIWAIVKRRVYLKYKPQTGLALKSFYKEKKKGGMEHKDIMAEIDQKLEEESEKNRNVGFAITPQVIQNEEGAPVVYVDRDSIKPLGFEGEPSTVKPNEVGAALLSIVQIKVHKALAATSQLKTYQILTMLGVGVILILVFLAFSNTNTIIQQNETIIHLLGNQPIVSQQVQNGQLVISGG